MEIYQSTVTAAELEAALTNEGAGFENGMKAERERFWELFFPGGPEDYSYRFYYVNWTDETYHPDPTKQMVIDGTWRASAIYGYASITNTIIDIIATANVNFNSTFQYARKLVTIPRIVLTKGCYFNNTFVGCESLENLNIEGTLGGTGFDVSPCTKLTHDSLMTIINALETKTSGTHTCTLGSTNLAKLTDAEKAIATGKGWTLA